MGRKKILVADDSRTVLMMEQMILSRGDYDVVTAQDGEEAVEKAGSFSPDLILLDVMMPRLDGYSACRKIRENAATAHIPVIMVTTRGDAESRDAGYHAGCNEYVAKPIDGSELLSKVRALIGD